VRDVVDEKDRVVGTATKEEVQEKGLICRVAFVMLANSSGELILHQRSASKKAYPLYWSGSAAGHLNSGESYEEAAVRELREELGVTAPLTLVGKFFSVQDNEMVGVLLGLYDGELALERAEVNQVAYFSRERLERERSDMKITTFVERALPLVAGELNWR
jgi:isopentenyldiphosphate isomerase